jgi:hypothetical protein
LTRLKRRKNPLKARRKSHLVATVEMAMTSPRNPRSEVAVKAAENEGIPVNLRAEKIARVAMMSIGKKIVGHVLRKLIHPKTRSRFVVTSNIEQSGECAQMKCAVKIGACAQMIGKYARMMFIEMVEECGRMMFIEMIEECGQMAFVEMIEACGQMTFAEMIEECGRMMFGETTGACGRMMLVETIGECALMTFAGMIRARALMMFVEMIGVRDLVMFVEMIGGCGRMMFAATIGPCARTIFDEKNGMAIATSLGEMIAGGMIMNGNSVLEETKKSRESVFGTWKRKKCAKCVVGTKTMGETNDHATMIDQERKPLLPRNRGIFQTKTLNLVVNPRSTNTSGTGKRTEMAETTVVKIATVPEEKGTEIGTAVEEKGMLSARKVGIEVNEIWVGTLGTKTALETIVGRRQDRTVQVQGRMVHRHHLVEETVLLLPKVEGMLVEISATMGVSQTIGVVSLFGTSDTLHSGALLHHVVGGIVIAVEAMEKETKMFTAILAATRD